MARRDRHCTCCGSKYQYCPTCGQDKTKPVWMTQFCSDECKTLWETATKYNMKKLTKDEAKEVIEKLELKEKSVYAECIQKDLDNILAEELVVVEETAEEEVKVEEEIVPILEEKPVFTPKKKQKSHEVVKKEYK